MLSTLLTIFMLQVLYVTVLTVRTILTVKGYKYAAAFLSAVDVFIYVMGFKIVLENLDRPLPLLIYCISYGIGILVGIRVEERLALGYVMVQVVSTDSEVLLARDLRQKGYGITTWAGEGLDGQRQVLSIMIQRKRQKKLYQDIYSLDSKAFVISYEPRNMQGGFVMKPVNPFR
ncbi:DUF2179 domain-containing protein [Risungbinella massiliensis]|uniref:DUF2179 domain-containing protein n=1 Tax=Risungbinella massiliensis TaxID=1329796 RepID=UPI0005CC6DEA|nr:DUF2179 domain-containing protein [Risungbinella massiliensis]